MRCILLGVALLGSSALAADALAQQQPRAKTAPAPSTRTAAAAGAAGEEKAIRALADSYTKAYNAHDAKAVAALFTPDAEIVDSQGDAIQGRPAIQEVFAAIFQEHPKAITSVNVKRVRFLNPSLAVEDGTANVTLVPGEAPEPNDYKVVHVKQDGRWLMASAHDLPSDSAAPEQHLKQLAWLIGEWIDESPESLVTTSYRWDESHNFILSDFEVKVAGKPVLSGTQRIGWDPLAKTIRSWIFDSEGGFAEGVYSHSGDRWIIKLSGVTRDGRPASATNIITRAGKDRMTWLSRDRMNGDEVVPEVAEVTVVRKPPQPK